MRVAQEKFGGVHENTLAVFSLDRKSPQRRFRKRIAHRAPFVLIVAYRAIVQVRLDQQHLRPAALKAHDARRAQLPAVQPDIVRANPRRQRALIQKFSAPLVDLQPKLPSFGVPIQVEVARQLLRPSRLLGDRGGNLRFLSATTRARARSSAQVGAGPEPGVDAAPSKAPTINASKTFDIFHASEFTRCTTEETFYIKTARAPTQNRARQSAILKLPRKARTIPTRAEKRQPCQNFASPSSNI